MADRVDRRLLAALIFTAVLGVAGWAFLTLLAWRGLGPESLARPDGPSIALFAIIILGGRAGAVRTEANQVLALDAAFYVAAAVCLGSVLAGLMVATALTIDAAVRLAWMGDEERARRAGWVSGIGYVLFFGGMTGAVITAVGWTFDLDSLFVLSEQTDAAVLGRLLIAGTTFVAVHYALQGVRAALSRHQLREFLRRVALPGALAEAAMMPLAVVVVYVYQPDEPLRLALLGFTYVVINFAFNRIYASAVVLRRRVRDLEALNASSRRLASSLETGDVLEAIAAATTDAIASAAALHLYRVDDGGWKVDSYRRSGRKFSRASIEETPKLVEQVVESFDRVLSRDRGWLGVPLGVHGEVVGVLAIEAARGQRFGNDDRRLLEAIAAQAAVALQNAELYALAMVDGLTRLYVRRYFDARLAEEILRSKRFGTIFSLVMMDIDNFKGLNDRYGHLVGDRVLVAVAEVIHRELRGVDTAARYGGEEFAMILPRTSMVEAYNVAERIRVGIEELAVRGDARPVSVTASFGIASFPESTDGGAEDLVRRADLALYRAKRTGKNRVELFWGEDADAEPRLAVVDDVDVDESSEPA